jgi:hypothetical protein
MRMRLPTSLLVLALMLLGFAPEALASGTRDLPTGVKLRAQTGPSGGAALAPSSPGDTLTGRPAKVPPSPPTDTPQRPGRADPSKVVPESGTTTQAIVQLQISGCTSHCHGTTQSQAARQQQTTVQAVATAPHPGHPQDPVQTTTAARSSTHTSRVTRGQIGCLAHCFGASTRGMTLNGRHRSLRQLLRALTGRPPVAPVAPVAPAAAAGAAGAASSGVHQSSYQWQRGLRAQKRQRQRSSQASITVQTVKVSSRLIDNLPAVLSSSAGPVAAAVNQTVQRIWQLQIGCLFHCSHTRQSQRAKQVSTTIQLVPRQATAAVSQDNTAQSIWQLQVGCLVWCIDATELQLAGSRHATLSTATTTRPPGGGHSFSIQLESSVASQTGGSGVVVVASSGKVATASESPRRAERPHKRHVAVAHQNRARRSKASKPGPRIVTAGAIAGPAASADVVLGVFIGLIVLLAALAASRVAAGRLRR